MNKFIYILFIFLAFSSQCIYSKSFKYDLCIAAIFQDEAPYMKEWIDYHLKVGVDHFFLYNNNSHDDYKEVLRPYIKNHLVTLIQWDSIQEDNDWFHYSFDTQTGAYNHALAICKKKTKWLALIDLDEYIVPVKYDNIVTLLENDYSDVSGLCVNWQCYGTSHIWQCKSVLHELVWKMKWDNPRNLNSKSIVQPEHVLMCPNPHLCLYLHDHWAVDVKRNRCHECCHEVNIDIIRINHYWTKDEKFLHEVKIPRYLKWGSTKQKILDSASEMNEEYDPILSIQLLQH